MVSEIYDEAWRQSRVFPAFLMANSLQKRQTCIKIQAVKKHSLTVPYVCRVLAPHM